MPSVSADRVPTGLAAALEAAELVNNRPGRARHLAEVATSTANGDPETLAVAERVFGMVSTLRGNLAAAAEHLGSAIDRAERADLTIRSAEARGSLAYVLILTGATADALSELDKAGRELTGVPAARLDMMRGLVLTEIGNLSEAEEAFAQALSTLSAAGGNELLEADVRNNRGILRIHQRDWAAVEDDLRLAESLYIANGHLGRTALVFHNRGLAATTRGDLPAALTAFDEAERRYLAAGRSSGLLPVERAEGLLSVLLVAEARRSAAAAVAEFTGQGNAVDLVQARLVLARAALLDRDPRSALDEADRARRSALRQRRPGWAALAGHLALRARWESGDYGRSAIPAGRRTIRALTQAGLVVAALDAQLVLARIALQLGRIVTARRLLAEAVLASDDGPAELRARAWHAQALLCLADGDPEGAEAALDRGMGVLDDFRASLGATELRAHASGHFGELAELGLRLAIEAGDPERLLSWAERWRAGALRLRPVRPPDAADLAQDLAELRQIVATLRANPDGARATALIERQTALEQAIQHRAGHAGGRSACNRGPAGLADLRGALHGRALVEFVKVGGHLQAVVVTEKRVAATNSARPNRSTTNSTGYVTPCAGSPTSSGHRRRWTPPSPSWRKRRPGCDALLLLPLCGYLGDAPLVLVPTSGLHAMPWAVLPSCAGRPLSVAPSAALWHQAATAVNATATGVTPTAASGSATAPPPPRQRHRRQRRRRQHFSDRRRRRRPLRAYAGPSYPTPSPRSRRWPGCTDRSPV